MRDTYLLEADNDFGIVHPMASCTVVLRNPKSWKQTDGPNVRYVQLHSFEETD